MLLLLVFASMILATVLSFVVLARNSRSPLHRWLSFFIISASLWVLFVNLQHPGSSETLNLWLVRSSFIAALLMVYGMWRFALTLSKAHTKKSTVRAVTFVVGFGALLCLTPWVISNVRLVTDTIEPERHWLYVLILLVIVGLAIASLVPLVRRFKVSRSRIERTRLAITLLGLTQGIIIGTVTNAILPNVVGSITPARFAFIPVTLWAVLLSYAIIRHRFLDIRVFVAKSVAYALLLVTLAVLYGAAIFTLTEIFFRGSAIGWVEQATYATLAVFLAFTFQPLKAFFDRVTSKLFYKDKYDTQKVLDRLSGIVSNSVDLTMLTRESTEVLHRSLKPQFVLMILVDEKGNILDKESHGTYAYEPKKGVELARKAQHDVVITDEVVEENEKLASLLSEMDIGAVMTMKANKQTLGYILVGYKQSGDPFSYQDISLLGIANDEIAISIQNALRFREIQLFNKTLQQKVDEATIKLRRTNAKLQELDEAKDEFVSMASHQLRTPLTSVKGYLSMALEGDAGELNTSQKKLLEEAYTSSQRMVYLIGDFLNVSRIKTGKFMLEYADSNLANVIDDEIDQLRATAKVRDIDFVYHEPKSFPTVRLDENKVRQVIMNMIDNAIYYSRPGGTITVELFTKDESVVFRVKDEGIGVPAREQKDLFEKFYRASNARKVRPDGTGIGLFMIKKVILAHGGSIIFHSTENKGSTFGFTVPIKKRAEP